MADLMPVDGNPFESAPASGSAPTLTPVEGNPFEAKAPEAKLAPVAGNPFKAPNALDILAQTPYKVTSPADLARVKPGQLYVNDKGMFLRKDGGNDVMVDDSPQGLTTQPLPSGPKPGLWDRAKQLAQSVDSDSSTLPKKIGTDLNDTAGGIGHSLTQADTYKEAPAAFAAGFGKGSTGLERAAGNVGELEGQAINHPVAMYKKFAAMALAIQNGDLEMFKTAAAATPQDFGATGKGNFLGNEAIREGKGLDAAGKEGEEYYADFAKQHGIDEETNQAWGKHATALGVVGMVGEQLPQIAVTSGAGLAGGKLTMGAIESVSPGLAKMAAAGVPKALDAVNRAVKLGSTITSASTQTLVIAGSAGANAHDEVMGMDNATLMKVNPAFAARVNAGEKPDDVKAQMADVAANKAQILALASAPVAIATGKHLAQAKMLESEAAKKVVEGGVNNAITQGAIQFSVNEGARYGDPTIQPFQGVAGQAFGGAVVGSLIEGIGAIGSHAEARTEERYHPDEGQREEETGTIKRAALVAKTKAGMGEERQPELDAKADAINRRLDEGKVERAGRIAGVDVSPSTKDSEPADLRKGIIDPVKDAIKKFYLSNNPNQQQDENGKPLTPEAQMAAKRMAVQAVARWATMNGGRTPTEYANAMRDLADSGQLRDDIEEATKDQFNGNGTLTAKALEDDLIANPNLAILHARPDPKQVEPLVASLRQQGINPYVTPHGDVAVVGTQDTLSKLQQGPFRIPNLTSTITENHYGQAFHQEGAGAEAGAAPAGQGPAEAHEAAAQRPAGRQEGGPRADVPAAAQGQVRPLPKVPPPLPGEATPPLPTARAKPVTEALAQKGVAAPVAPDGRVTVAPDHPEAAKVAAVAANDAATSEDNGRRAPTEGQMRNGNYPKGKLVFPSAQGDIKVNIESPAGSVRRSLPGQSPAWSRKIVNHYGYIPGTISNDGEPVDAIVGRNAHDDTLPVFVVHQTDPSTGKFDELKVVLGAKSEGQAMAMYKAEYPQALHQKLLQGTPKVVRMDRGQFNAWVKGGEHDVPINPMSRQPMLKLRDATGQAQVTFGKDASREDVASLANGLNAKLHTTLTVEKAGDGYRIVGDIPKAKMPALDRSARRIDGHQETTYDGQDVRAVFTGRGEADRNGVPERPQEPVLREAGAEGDERGSEGVPQGSGQEGRGVQGPAQAQVGERLYDVTKDPDGIIERAEKSGRADDKAAILYAVHRAGYDGVTMPGGIGGTPLKLRIGEKARRQRTVDVPGFGAMRFDQSHDVELLGGSSKDGSTVYADRDWNPVAKLRMLDGSFKAIDRSPFLGVHELVERKLEDQGEGYTTAHREAQREENAEVTKAGIDWKAYQESYDADVAAAAKKAGTGNPPPDLVPKPYEHPHSVREREALSRVEQAEGQSPRYLFAGRKAANPPEGRERAEKAESAGVSPELVHAGTGWSRGTDGDWRFELDDSKASVRPHEEWEASSREGGVPLEKVYDHPALYEQYPFLRGVIVKEDPSIIHGGSAANPRKAEIRIGTPDRYEGNYPEQFKRAGEPIESLQSILTHEVQHLVQDFEGHARGGSPREFYAQVQEGMDRLNDQLDALEAKKAEAAKAGDDARVAELDKEIASASGDLSKRFGIPQVAFNRAYSLYHSLAGETEARNAQTRLGLNAAERRARHPAATEDVKRSAQVVARPGQKAPEMFHEQETHDGDDAAVRGAAQARAGELPATAGGRVRGQGGVRGGAEPLAEPRRSDVAPLAGLPAHVKVNGKVRTFGPNPVAHAAAEDYAKASGIPYQRPISYAKVDEARAERIADAYEAMEHAPDDPAVRKAYRAMIDETLAQWHQIAKTGLKVDFIKPGQRYPYKNPREVFDDLDKNNHMWVFPTTEGFGGSESAHVDISGNPLLEPTGITLGGHPTVANDIFRIVHDYFGHYKEGVGFRAEGEENAWRAHAAMYSPLARQAMTTETRGQNSWVNYGPYGKFNRTASGEDTQYAPQKVGLLPEWVSEEGRGEEPTDQQLTFHVEHLQAHADKLAARWNGSPPATVVRSEEELPKALRDRMGLVAPEQKVDGVIYGDHAYLVGKNLQSREHVERVLTHEVMGHYGLQRVFGDKLPALLESVHASIKDSEAFKALAERYGSAYAGMGPKQRALAITEEFLADKAELKAQPKALDRLVAAVRQWARSVGMVRHWTENDVLNLMHGVARDVRDGRVSPKGLSKPDTTFDQEGTGFTSTYRGAAGEGIVHTDEHGVRQVAIGGFTGTGRRTLVDEGSAIQFDHVSLAHPDDILVAPRLAGEEGKVAVLLPTHTEAALRAARVPYERVDGFLKAPASRIRDPEPRFSIRASQVDDPALAARIDRVLERPEADLTPWDRMQRWWREVGNREALHETGLAWLQHNVDQLASIGAIERKGNGGLLRDASESAYKFGWMAGNTKQVMNAMLNKGVPIYKDGSFQPAAGRKGLLQIFAPLHTSGKKGAERMWEFYAMARRSDQLQHQLNPDGTSKEKLMTPDDIKAGLALAAKHPEFKQVFDDWQSFNHDLLDLAVSRGNMTKEMADLWKQNDYVPFYRVLEDGEEKGGLFASLKVASKRLTGSNAKVQPLIDNIFGNTQAIMRKVYLNEALRRTAAIGDGMGIERIPMKAVPQKVSIGDIENKLEKMGLFVGQQANAQRGAKLTLTPAQQDKWATFFRMQEPDLPNTFKVMENGKAQYFRVDDPLLMNAIGSMQKQEAIGKLFRFIFTGPKNLLTHAITLNPAFMLRHLERQMTHTFVQSGENFNPFHDAISSAVDAYTNSDFMQRMQMAGAGGNEYYDIADPRKVLRRQGPTTVVSSLRDTWQAYRKIGYVADQMNRMSIAKSVLARGGSVAEAAWQAQDLLNFGMHGNGTVMRHIVGAVPFLNARVQGMYRIMRGASGLDQSYRARSKAVRAFLLKSSLLIAASQALALKNNGDPRYERLPDEAKDLYWHIFAGNYHFAIAKPFEIGAIFSTMPDRMVRYAEGLDGTGTFVKSLERVFETVFRFDPTPATLNPIVQNAENKDELTQRPIVNESLQGLDPSLQFNPSTSPTIKAVAQHMPRWAPDFARSPLRLQHMVDGYVGTLGLYAQQTADAAVRTMSPQPPAPAPRLGSRVADSVLGSMVGRSDTDPRNRFEELVFQQKAELDTAAKTIKAYQKAGAEQDLERYAMQHKTELQHRNDILAAYRQMEGYRRDENAIYQSPTLTSAQKRELLDKIAKDRNAYLGRIAPLLNLIDSE